MSRDQQWSTRLGVILAVAGSAVGLGNFLRFPGQAAANGGGAFLIPYFCALVFLGIPIGWAEWTMARYGGRKGFHSAPGILGVIGGGRVARYLGVMGVLIPLAVSFYYVFIEAWTLGYFWKYLTGGLGIDPTTPIAQQSAASATFYNQFTGNGADGALFTWGGTGTIWFWLITFGLNIYFVFRGLSKGIEKFCTWAMPAMAVCGLIVLIRVLTLGTPDPAQPTQNVVNGLGYMWNPDFKALGNFQTWLAAAGQIFFSISVGFGIIINYASYCRRKDDIVLSALTSTATNEVFEVGFGGMITLTASFIFLGLAGTTAAVASGSFSLGFTTLPVVFAHMGGFGNLIGALWFLMLFLAAITSSLSMYQPSIAFIEEALDISRTRATAIMMVLGVVGSCLTIWFTQNGTFWSTLDFWVGTLLIFVMAAVEIILFGWVFGIDRAWEEAHQGAAIRIPRAFRFIMKYVAPVYLLVVFVGFCVRNLGASIEAAMASTGARIAIGLIVVTLLTLLITVALAERRWKAQGLDMDGRRPPDDEPAPAAGGAR